MKIAFIAKFKDIWDEEPIAKALEFHGIEVIRLEENGYNNEYYIHQLKKEKPNLVLFTKLRVRGDSQQLLDGIKELGIPTISWTFDLYIGHPAREWGVPSFPFLKADQVILTDGGHVDEYNKLGIKKHTIRQGVPKEFCFLGKPNEKYKYDVAFVGTANGTFPYRQRVMKFLEDTYGERFHWFGKENSHEVRGDELNDLYASAKVLIGDSMYADYYWSNRVYETLGRGGFLINPRVMGMETEFEWFKHLVPYYWGDLEGLREKIDYYVEHDAKRDVIRMAGYEHVKQNFIWEVRIKEFISLCQKLFPTLNFGKIE